MRKPGLQQLVPGPRQLEAFYLRCIGLCWAEIGDRMGVSRVTAYCYATDAAERLIRTPPTPDIRERRELALYHFPQAASRILETELNDEANAQPATGDETAIAAHELGGGW